MTTATKTKAKTRIEERVQPIYKARLGAMQIALWDNEHVTNDGEVQIFHNGTLERNFKNTNNEWQKTVIQLRAGDFGDAIALMQQAQHFLTKVD